MAPPYCYDYPRPAVTVDLVVFRLVDAGLRVLLIRRERPPFEGHWAFPGGFLEIDEPIEAAARRELQEETGLQVNDDVSFLGVFGTPGRDPRGRTISMVYAAVVRKPDVEVQGGDDASEAQWMDPYEARPLAFDHNEILACALKWLDDAVDLGPTGVGLLPDPFHVADVKRLFQVLGKPSRKASPWLNRQVKEQRVVSNEDGQGQEGFRPAHS